MPRAKTDSEEKYQTFPKTSKARNPLSTLYLQQHHKLSPKEAQTEIRKMIAELRARLIADRNNHPSWTRKISSHLLVAAKASVLQAIRLRKKIAHHPTNNKQTFRRQLANSSLRPQESQIDNLFALWNTIFFAITKEELLSWASI